MRICVEEEREEVAGARYASVQELPWNALLLSGLQDSNLALHDFN